MTEKKASSEATPEYYLNLIFEKFEAQEERLTQTGAGAASAMDVLLGVAREAKTVFDEDGKQLYVALDGFKKILGHTDHLVIYVDLQRKRLSQPLLLAEQAVKQAELSGQQQQMLPTATAISNQPVQADYGFWHFMGERRRSIALERVLGQAKQPQILTSQRQEDFMNYAKDIPAELNKIYMWLGGTLLRFRRFNCEVTQVVCYSQLRTHLEMLAAQTVGFSNATIELRKELVGEREVAYAQAMSVIEQARIMVAAGMKVSGSGPGDNLTELLRENLRRRT